MHWPFSQDVDLRIGQTLNVFGRKVVITDCDEFTRNYYQSKYGFDEFLPIIEKPIASESTAEKVVPPYNGWGSFEDSEANCRSIGLKMRQLNMKKFLYQNNRKLRFKAQMISNNDNDISREFIITYFLEDDTISVYEIGIPNLSSPVIIQSKIELCEMIFIL